MPNPEPSVEERIEAAVLDYRSVWPEPLPLSPNLQLAVEAAKEYRATAEWASAVFADANRYRVEGERLMEMVLGARDILAQMQNLIDESAVIDEGFYGVAAELRKVLGVDD